MKHRPIPLQYACLADFLLPKVLPWRKLTIAIDGVDGAGKSTLARFLSWQLEMPEIETDFFLRDDQRMPVHDTSSLATLVQARHKNNRPLIVEGVFVLRQLGAIGVNPEFLIRVQCKGRTGNSRWQSAFTKYRAEFPRAKTPDYTLRWAGAE